MKNFFLFNKKTENNKGLNHELIDQYKEMAKLVKEARIQQNLTIQELSRISKIPEQTINSIENNNQNSDLVEQIKKLDQLYKSGVLTKDEFEKAKKKLLN